MRNLIVGLAVTLDGYIEGPNGEHDWCFTDQDYGLHAFFSRIDAVFIGRKSYEVAQQYADSSGLLVPGMPPVKQYVFSTTLQTVRDGVENPKSLVVLGGAESRWEHNSDEDKAGYLNLHYRVGSENMPIVISTGGLYRDKQRTNFFNE